MSELILPPSATDGNFADMIFNPNKTDYDSPALFLGQRGGLGDTIHDHHPELWKYWRALRSLDWDTNEFNFEPCKLEFQTVKPGISQAMIQNLGFQWESDTEAANGISAVANHFVTNSALKTVWEQITANENLHWTTYSEIVRYSFDNPDAVLKDVLGVKESIQRFQRIGEAMGKAYRIGLEYSLGLRKSDDPEVYQAAFMFTVALFLLERVNFMGSFAVTGAIAQTGDFIPICNAVQRIAQDEAEVHVNVGKYVIGYELTTPRGQACWKANRTWIDDMIMECRASEMRWIGFQRDSGSIVPGVGWDELKTYVNFNVADACDVLHRPVEFSAPSVCNLPYMTKWLDVSKTQHSPQESDIGQYRVNVVRSNDEGIKLPFNLHRAMIPA
jgi:ribonucleoside-diphosphate reductase beta chain